MEGGIRGLMVIIQFVEVDYFLSFGHFSNITCLIQRRNINLKVQGKWTLFTSASSNSLRELREP
jgi:hypothetical protein